MNADLFHRPGGVDIHTVSRPGHLDAKARSSRLSGVHELSGCSGCCLLSHRHVLERKGNPSIFWAYSGSLSSCDTHCLTCPISISTRPLWRPFPCAPFGRPANSLPRQTHGVVVYAFLDLEIGRAVLQHFENRFAFDLARRRHGPGNYAADRRAYSIPPSSLPLGLTFAGSTSVTYA